jgi:hypothetical protein
MRQHETPYFTPCLALNYPMEAICGILLKPNMEQVPSLLTNLECCITKNYWGYGLCPAFRIVNTSECKECRLLGCYALWFLSHIPEDGILQSNRREHL